MGLLRKPPPSAQAAHRHLRVLRERRFDAAALSICIGQPDKDSAQLGTAAPEVPVPLPHATTPYDAWLLGVHSLEKRNHNGWA